MINKVKMTTLKRKNKKANFNSNKICPKVLIIKICLNRLNLFIVYSGLSSMNFSKTERKDFQNKNLYLNY